MDVLIKQSLWLQFGAAIDALGDAINACPDELWADDSQHMKFWYTVYHTLFWTDSRLSGPEEGFQPPAPFDLGEMDPAGVLPDRVYSKDEMRTYLAHCRQKCQAIILDMSDERAAEVISLGRRKLPFYELQMYNMRHVQEHTAQLGFMIGQHGAAAPDWVSRAR
jgi:hypothetical protein